MDFDFRFAASILPELLQGLWVTVQATAMGFTIAIVLGLAVAIVRRTRLWPLRALLRVYVEVMRGTPLLVLLYFLFFVLPDVGIVLPSLVVGVIGIGAYYSGYTAEVFRAGIASVDQGQWDAATAVSLPRAHTWRTIVLPQALRAIAPSLGNYANQMFKDSAILAAITVLELLFRAKRIGSSTFQYVEPLTMAGLLFLVISIPTALAIRRLERRLHAPQRG